LKGKAHLFFDGRLNAICRTRPSSKSEMAKLMEEKILNVQEEREREREREREWEREGESKEREGESKERERENGKEGKARQPVWGVV
jgi:CRISPR/Cas system-associated endonuclease Cas1